MNALKKLLILILLSIYTTSQGIYAAEVKNLDYLERQNFTKEQKKKWMTVWKLFTLYFNAVWEWIPESYKFIDLKFEWVEKDTPIYETLQKWVYLDLIKNTKRNLKLETIATEKLFSLMVEKDFSEKFWYKDNSPLKLWKFLDIMSQIKIDTEENLRQQYWSNYDIENVSSFYILNDVYVKLKWLHYDSDKLKDTDLMNWAIKWMADAAWDKYTVYFPPVEAKDFTDSLNWEFEWIWAQVDMSKPWILTIIAPLPWTPAEKAWIKSWDIVKKIDWIEVTASMTIEQAISKIKWKAWTSVELEILRWNDKITIKITREKITMKLVNYKKLDNWDNYIQITSFWAWVYNAFSWAVAEVAKNSNSKTIIDLRNNPGWALDEVANILNFFVPNWEPTVNIKYKNISSDMFSSWSAWFTFKWKKVVILVNKWSASASEIMAWTIKDYLKDEVKIIWETSYWKWSVQAMDSYSDGSSFKYTIAKWFTWKTKTSIDQKWITPDIEVKLDENGIKSWSDNQLDYAKNYRF